MSDNGAPTWTVGTRETTWREEHRVVFRSPQRRHNAWAELYHRFDGRKIGDTIPDEDIDAVYETLAGHLVSLGGVPVSSDLIDDLTPWEAFGVFTAMWLGVPPTKAEQGESGAPSP